MHGCSAEHVRMLTVRLKRSKETEQEGKQKREKMERSTSGGESLSEPKLHL